MVNSNINCCMTGKYPWIPLPVEESKRERQKEQRRKKGGRGEGEGREKGGREGEGREKRGGKERVGQQVKHTLTEFFTLVTAPMVLQSTALGRSPVLNGDESNVVTLNSWTGFLA